MGFRDFRGSSFNVVLVSIESAVGKGPPLWTGGDVEAGPEGFFGSQPGYDGAAFHRGGLCCPSV